jgi:hypothetical protein
LDLADLKEFVIKWPPTDINTDQNEYSKYSSILNKELQENFYSSEPIEENVLKIENLKEIPVIKQKLNSNQQSLIDSVKNFHSSFCKYLDLISHSEKTGFNFYHAIDLILNSMQTINSIKADISKYKVLLSAACCNLSESSKSYNPSNDISEIIQFLSNIDASEGLFLNRIALQELELRLLESNRSDRFEKTLRFHIPSYIRSSELTFKIASMIYPSANNEKDISNVCSIVNKKRSLFFEMLNNETNQIEQIVDKSSFIAYCENGTALNDKIIDPVPERKERIQTLIDILDNHPNYHLYFVNLKELYSGPGYTVFKKGVMLDYRNCVPDFVSNDTFSGCFLDDNPKIKADYEKRFSALKTSEIKPNSRRKTQEFLKEMFSATCQLVH